MKASELRIGNIVGRRDIGNGELRTETIIELLEGKATTSGPIKVICPYDDLLPIPLTEEWLLRFGATKSYENWQYTIPIGGISLHLRRNMQWYSELGGIYLGSKIQYVHQLQNLYYVLASEELMITEPHSSADSNRNENL